MPDNENNTDVLPTFFRPNRSPSISWYASLNKTDIQALTIYIPSFLFIISAAAQIYVDKPNSACFAFLIITLSATALSFMLNVLYEINKCIGFHL